MPIPLTLVFIIAGLIVLGVFFVQNKHAKKFSWIFLFFALLLILTTLVFWLLFSLQN